MFAKPLGFCRNARFRRILLSDTMSRQREEFSLFMAGRAVAFFSAGSIASPA
ncbi:hypothetical protein NLM27_09960 [Bradyrhizobium sp. CCGB12]|uniref:hypothetical protein n=1 Tax=Bradyrhizobium sp. CCGB12 TaxID=2949632 RepID=UPI0020B3D0B1|nr:hypothetical protein [Bradyrhizobium sp. CCGB12]MCP3389098.1 hypothetical protein [Bradyrhizobium sp. CCGB12]